MLRRKIIGGFTLLEVMVAVAILGLALTAIFSAQAGAIRTAVRARSISTATLLARCKMGEIEEHMAHDGFPSVHEDGDDECCEDSGTPGFTCSWDVTRITLPEAGDMANADPLGMAAGIGGGAAGASSDPAAGQASLQGALAGGGASALGDFAMMYAFPLMKPAIEEQVRRATVTVHWQEGHADRSFEVVQFIVQDQGVQIPGTGQPGTPGAPGTPGVPGAPGQTPGLLQQIPGQLPGGMTNPLLGR